jgi:hypothetical protein
LIAPIVKIGSTPRHGAPSVAAGSAARQAMSARYWFGNVVVGVIWGTSFLFIAMQDGW